MTANIQTTAKKYRPRIPKMPTMHTTLAQDAFRLYFGVMDYVCDHLKSDLIQKKGKSEEEAIYITEVLRKKWRQKLRETKCIDEENLMGFRLRDMSTTNDHILPSTDNQSHISYPMNNIPISSVPRLLEPNYPSYNPHVQGMGVPNIGQVHNPFIHPINAQSNMPQIPYFSNLENIESKENTTNVPQNDIQFMASNESESKNVDIIEEQTIPSVNYSTIAQFDGPSPMMSSAIGFSDEDEDDDVNEEHKNVDRKSGKIENTNVKISANIDAENEEINEKDIVNGKDLNAPLNSDDDDSEEDINLDTVEDKILCTFTKVSRKKNEWNITLGHGIMHIQDKDYAFVCANNGHFVWE